MPSLLIATKRKPDGTTDKIVTPLIDYGPESIQAIAEENRLRGLGYETRIERERERIAKPEGQTSAPVEYRKLPVRDSHGEGRG